MISIFKQLCLMTQRHKKDSSYMIVEFGPLDGGYAQCSRIRILCFFQISKKHDFLRFFEMTYQKVVKSL